MRTLTYALLSLPLLGAELDASAQFRCTVVDPAGEQSVGPTTFNTSAAFRGQDITIPVVFHVLWHTNAENVSDAALLEQLNVLNQDFRRTNPDATNTPADLLGITAGSNFQFCFADFDPWGNPTNGITRTYTDTVLWLDTWFGNDNIFDDATGGVDPWDQHHYLNVYVFNRSYFLGTASQPPSHGGGHDGVSIDYVEAAGGTRTLTHEVGHYFGLSHVQGGTSGEVSCGDDHVDDTPLQTFHYNCPTYPTYSCGNTTASDLFMNYMDYSPSSCKNMFTQGQCDRMLAQFEQYRSSFLEVMGCSFVGVGEIAAPTGLQLSPNPASENVSLTLTQIPAPGTWILVIGIDGRTRCMYETTGVQHNMFIDVSMLSTGVYVVLLVDKAAVLSTERLVIV